MLYRHYSLLYEIQTNDIFNDMLQSSSDYDFSDYPPTHRCFDDIEDNKVKQIQKVNKKVIGKFKDELSGITLEEFIGLRPKCYSLLFRGKVKDNKVIHTDMAQKQTAKSVKESVKKAHLRHKHYKETLNNLSIVSVSQNLIKSRAHKVGTYHQTKVALTAFDTKRYICDDNINTLAYGHSCI